MAKKITITNDNHNFKLDEKSATYVLGEGLTADIKFSYTSADPSHPHGISRIRQGYDLVIIFDKNNGNDKYKTYTTTVKNFFNSLYTGTVDAGDINITTGTECNQNLRLAVSGKDITDSQDHYIYGNTKKNKYTLVNNGSYITDPKGNDTYEIGAASKAYVNDVAGNDTYVFAGADYSTASNIADQKGNDKYVLKRDSNGVNPSNVVLTEKTGNDTYDVSQFSMLQLTDNNGKDKYVLDSGKLKVQDNGGNDTYTAKRTDETYLQSTVKIVDNSATSNDTYKLSDTVSFKDTVGIEDHGGNDKYTLNTMGGSLDPYGDVFTAIDYKGKDTWSVTGVNYLEITDGKAPEASGNDTYKIKDATGHIKINDLGGSNKFTVTNSTFRTTAELGDVDPYWLEINAKGGTADAKYNDTYTLNNVKGLYYTETPETFRGRSLNINDDGGNDKFNLTDVEYLRIITQEAGADTFNLKRVADIEIQSKGNSDDKYTFTACGTTDAGTYYDLGNFIYDDLGNDSYTFKKLDGSWTFINDKNGNDKLTVTGEKYSKNGVIAVASGVGHASGTCHLFLYDTQSKGMACLSNFYTVTDGAITGTGAGYVETVKIGSKTIKMGEAAFMYDLNQLNDAVSGWLSSSTTYQDKNIDAVFMAHDTEAAASLVAQVFQGGNAVS